MDEKYSVDGLIRQLMKGANENYVAGIQSPGLGFVVSKPKDGGIRKCGFIHASTPLEALPRMRKFAAVVRSAMKFTDCDEAGILCDLHISMEGAIPEPTVVLYVDQRFAGMRVFVAPRRGENLVFRDMGTAHPTNNFFPPLFTPEHYGEMADA